MNYEALLKKYMRQVKYYEGLTYLSDDYRGDGGPEFLDKEWAELQRLDRDNE